MSGGERRPAAVMLSDDEAEALRRLAASRHRSARDGARAAIRAHIERADHIEQLTREVVDRHADLLRGLGES